MNPFGRGCPGPGGTKPPPPSIVGSTQSDDIETTNDPFIESKKQQSIEKPNKNFGLVKDDIVRKITTNKPKSQCSQSGKTFVDVTFEEENLKKMVPPIVSPDKVNDMSTMTKLDSLVRKSTFFSSKRKKVDGDEKWSRERIVRELTGLLTAEELNDLQVKQKSEQELRKHLYQVLSNTKKLKGNEEETMDVGNLLLDSTMTYVPILSEHSSDPEIEGLEKHDAILELANFIKKCGKRVNFHTLNDSTLQELHANIKIARDDHKRVKQVFPELSGIDSRWFGPRSERVDQDYEPSEYDEVELDDAWDDLSDDEIQDLETDIEVLNSDKVLPDQTSIRQSKDTDLEAEHQKLLQELYTQVENKPVPTLEKPIDSSEWSKEKLSEEILQIGNKIGQTHYYSVLMNSSREYLRKLFHTLLMTQKEKAQKKSQSTLTKENKKTKNDTKIKGEIEIGSDGEYEWSDNGDIKGNQKSTKGEPLTKEKSNQISKKKDQEEPKSASRSAANKEQNDKEKKSETNAQSNKVVSHGNISDEELEKLSRFELITLLGKHVGQNGKVPDDYLVNEKIENLLALCKDLKPKMALQEIKISDEDVKTTRFRIIRWKKREIDQKHGKTSRDIPGSFDPTFTLPPSSDNDNQENITESREQANKPEFSTSEPSEPNVHNEECVQPGSGEVQGFKQHNTYASVDREEKLNQEGMVFDKAGDYEGVDISQFTPKIQPQSLNEPPKEKQHDETKVVAITQKVFNIRVAYGLMKRGQHTPTDIKNFVNVVRQIDPQLKVLPFSEDKNVSVNDVDVITDETQLPNHQNELSKWVASIETSYNNKLHFGLRVSSILTFSELRRQLYDWCSKTKSFVKFDNIQSRKIFGAGWLLGIHPMYHNRNTLKAVLCRENPKLLDKISVYPRKVWLDSSENNQKTKTNGIVIDGCFAQKDEIISHLCSYKWSGQYTGVTFVPFKVNEALTEKHQQKAMQEQNLYLRDTWSKVLSVKENLRPIVCKKSKKQFTFIQWLKLCEIHGRKLLKGVEYISDEKVRIIYHRKREYDVCQMLTYLFPAIEEQFGKEVAETLLGDKETQMKHIKTKNIEHTYSANCAESIMKRSKPQKDTVNQPPKVKFHSNFGAVAKTVTSEKTRPKSYSEAASRRQIVVEPDPEIKAAIKALQEKQDEQSKTIVDLNEQLRLSQEKNNNEKCDTRETNEINEEDDDVDNEMREEIKALWRSQEEMKREINESIDEKISNSKEEILQVVEENKNSISTEIENLRVQQETATKQIKEQQSVNTFDVLTAIKNLTERMDDMQKSPKDPPEDPPKNPPISPVKQGPRHGGRE